METFRFTDSKMNQIASTWKKIANENNYKFKNILCTSTAMIDPINNEIKRFELHIPTRQSSSIIISTSEKQPLRLSFNFKKHLDFEFQVYPEDIFEKISKFIGAKEVEIGIKEFDNKYILKSDNEKLMKHLLDRDSIDFLLSNLTTNFSLRKDGFSIFSLVTSIHEEDKEEMLSLIGFAKGIVEKIYNWKN
ncbi:MAG: hypothetical protein GQ564_13810 [Bacteroidales bacterium]|nr:hypothetical protein [Bacteroidales bacterium]